MHLVSSRLRVPARLALALLVLIPLHVAPASGTTGLDPASSGSGPSHGLPPIVFGDDPGEGLELMAVRPDGTGRQGVDLDGSENFDPEWSPDGTKLAYVTRRNGSPDIFVYDTTTGRDHGVVVGPTFDADPTWSRDGTRLAFTTDPGGPNRFDVYEVGLHPDGTRDDSFFDGTAFRPVAAEVEAWESFPRYGADDVIYYQRSPLSFPLSFDIYAAALEGDPGSGVRAPGTAVIATPADEQHVAVSPDGNRLVYAQGDSLWELDLSDRTERRLTDVGDGGADSHPAYSPDGSQIVFVRTGGSERALHILDLASAEGSPRSVAVLNSDGLPHWSWSQPAPPPDPEPDPEPEPEPEPKIEVTVAGPESSPGSEWRSSATVRITGPAGVTYETRQAGQAEYQPYPGGDGAPVVGGDGVHLVEWRASNGESGSVTVRIDANGPAIDLTTPGANAVYLLGEVVTASYGCTDDGSGVVSCVGTVPDGSPVDTGRTSALDDPTWNPAPRTFTVEAGDGAGLRSSRSVEYRAKYAFEGFMAPIGNECGTYHDDVDDRPDASDGACGVVNVGTAGQNFPIKWRLLRADGYERDLRVVKQVATRRVACPDRPASEVASVESSGDVLSGEPLRFDADEQRYHYQFKTQKAWKGECRLFTVRLDDGTQHSALFRFR